VSATATVPAHLQAAWEEILGAEARIGEALEAGELATLEPLANRRHAQILDFFARFALEPDSGAQRLHLLQALIARNQALLGDSRARLSAASDAALQARHNRRALQAYAAQ